MNVLLKAAETAAGCEADHVVIAEEVVGLVGVDDEQSSTPTRPTTPKTTTTARNSERSSSTRPVRCRLF